MGMNEKRSWQRVKVNLKAKCRLVDVAAYSFYQITDIHHEGCCIVGESGFQEGQEVRIVVHIPTEGEIYLIGMIRWSRRDEKGEYNIGIKFLINGQMAEESSGKLYSFCVSR